MDNSHRYYIYPTFEIDINKVDLPVFVLYYIGITSAVKVGRPFDTICRKIKLLINVLHCLKEMGWSIIIARMVALLLGCFLLGIGINGFLVPHHLLDGGLIGLALILHYYFDVPAGLWSAILSIPLIIYAWVSDRKQFHGSVYGMIVVAIFIDLLAPYQFILPIWLSAILGGAICGIAVGIMLRYETSTGGTDLLAYFLIRVTPINIGLIIFFIDGIIVLIGYQSLGLRSLLFSILTILTSGFFASICYERRVPL